MLRSILKRNTLKNVSKNFFRSITKEENVEQLKNENDLGFKNNFNKEENDKILHAINNFSKFELKKFSISNIRLQKILQRREAAGEFKKIEDILELDGFGIKVLEKFCKSILTSNTSLDEPAVKKLPNETSETVEDIKKNQFVSPVVLEVVRNSIESVVSFNIDLRYFSWTKFCYDRKENVLDIPNFIVEDWESFEISSENKRNRLVDLIELVVRLENKIPIADAYIFESLPHTVQAKQPGSALQININVHHAQLVSMLAALMASRDSMNKLNVDENGKNYEKDLSYHQAYSFPSVFFLRQYLSSRLYRILIGGEKVSSITVVENIMDYMSKMNPEFNPSYSSVSIPYPLVQDWKKSSKIDQNYIGQSFLLGLTFLKLCVQKCNKSIALINRNSKRL